MSFLYSMYTCFRILLHWIFKLARKPTCTSVFSDVDISYTGCLTSQHATLVLWLSKGFYCSASHAFYEVKI